jgi:ribA/ribD-fused uncharacterized protein
MVPIKYDGWVYPSVEHAYQAAKTSNLRKREKIRCAPTSAYAKQLGKRVPMRPEWEGIKLNVMEDLLRKKFAINPFRDALINTGGAELVEGNVWNDVYWGVCKGVGENHLGKLLMKLRLELQDNNAWRETRQ